MIERDIVIPTADGAMPCFVVHPDEDGPFPVVLFYMDALGIREELRDMARRFATTGHYVMLANLYYRDGGPSFDTAPLAEGRLDPRMVALNVALTTAMTVRDTGAMLQFAAADPAADTARCATVGYCMGGRHAIANAAAFPGQVKAMASLHGGRLVNDEPDAPYRLIARMKAEAYFGWADKDDVAPLEHKRIVEDALAARGGRHRVELHPGALHGFTFPERYCYHKAAAELVWARLFAMFRRTLRG